MRSLLQHYWPAHPPSWLRVAEVEVEAVLAERAAEQVAGLLEARRLAVARDRHWCQRQQVPQMGTLEPPAIQLTQPPSLRDIRSLQP